MEGSFPGIAYAIVEGVCVCDMLPPTPLLPLMSSFSVYPVLHSSSPPSSPRPRSQACCPFTHHLTFPILLAPQPSVCLVSLWLMHIFHLVFLPPPLSCTFTRIRHQSPPTFDVSRNCSVYFLHCYGMCHCCLAFLWPLSHIRLPHSFQELPRPGH